MTGGDCGDICRYNYWINWQHPGSRSLSTVAAGQQDYHDQKMKRFNSNYQVPARYCQVRSTQHDINIYIITCIICNYNNELRKTYTHTLTHRFLTRACLAPGDGDHESFIRSTCASGRSCRRQIQGSELGWLVCLLQMLSYCFRFTEFRLRISMS